MDALDEAVYDRMTGLASFEADRVWWDLAFGDPGLPLAVLRAMPSIPPEYDSSNLGVEERTIRVSVYAATRDRVRELLREVEAAFVMQALALSSGSVVHCLKGSDDCFLDPDRDEDAALVWHGVIDLVFSVCRTPGD